MVESMVTRLIRDLLFDGIIFLDSCVTDKAHGRT